MIAPTLLELVPTFLLECIGTEIRWIVRVRSVRTRLGGPETANAGSAIPRKASATSPTTCR